MVLSLLVTNMVSTNLIIHLVSFAGIFVLGWLMLVAQRRIRFIRRYAVRTLTPVVLFNSWVQFLLFFCETWAIEFVQKSKSPHIRVPTKIAAQALCALHQQFQIIKVIIEDIQHENETQCVPTILMVTRFVVSEQMELQVAQSLGSNIKLNLKINIT